MNFYAASCCWRLCGCIDRFLECWFEFILLVAILLRLFLKATRLNVVSYAFMENIVPDN